MNSPKIKVDKKLCKHCRKCVQVCPASVLVWNEQQMPEPLRVEQCILCGHCVDVCISDALEHSAFPPEHIHKVQRELLPTPQSLMELIRSRRSNRTITSRPVPQSMIEDIIEAARYAPTAENTRRVVVTILEDEAIKNLEDIVMRFFLRLSKVLMNPLMRPLTKRLLPDLYAEAPELERFKKRWEHGELPCCCNASKVLVFSAPSSYDFGWQDCNLAYQNASLMAEAHGLSQVYLGLVQTALKFMPNGKVAHLLHLPKGHIPRAYMALGFPLFTYPRYTVR